MPPRVLVIEDDAACRELFRYLLDRAGFVVSIAADGAEGVRLGAGAKPDLVLCDLGLPVLDGLEVMRRLKAAPGCAALPVVALTADATTEGRESALAAGFAGYLNKLVEPADFVRQVSAFVAPGRARSPA